MWLTDVVKNGTDFGTFTNIVYRNTDLAERHYQGWCSRVAMYSKWTVNGFWTIR